MPIAAAACFQLPGHVAHNAVKKGVKTAGAVALIAGKKAVALESGDEYLLHGVVEILQVRGISPVRGEIGADNRLIALGESGALGRAAVRVR